MYKFFVPGNQIEEDIINIIGTDVNHISNVLRLKIDDEILVTNKDNEKTYLSKIVKFSKENIICRIIKNKEDTTESNIYIDIYQGLPKSDKMEYIIQKTTELGVKNIIPVDMERCVVKIDKKSESKKIERWQKISEVAAKQSKRDYIPKIGNIIKIEDICNITSKYDIILLAYEDENKTTIKDELKRIKQKSDNKLKIGIIIGPEGGLSEKEVNKLISSGIKCVSLGKRILRTETAPIVMVSDIIYEFEL
jgi:16S rRNA (uracil1498-N3)-methyltransferase